jgi:hypothetical protein
MLRDPHDDANQLAFDLVDAVDEALRATRDLTPSEAARRAKCSRLAARAALYYLIEHGFAHTSGNGAWTHYHPFRR